jgi:hypothetical protein
MSTPFPHFKTLVALFIPCVSFALAGCKEATSESEPPWILAAESLEIPSAGSDVDRAYETEYCKPAFTRASKYLRGLTEERARTPYPILARIRPRNTDEHPALLLMWFQLGTDECEVILFGENMKEPIGRTTISTRSIERVQEKHSKLGAAAIRLIPGKDVKSNSVDEDETRFEMRLAGTTIPRRCTLSLKSRLGESEQIDVFVENGTSTKPD